MNNIDKVKFLVKEIQNLFFLKKYDLIIKETQKAINIYPNFRHNDLHIGNILVNIVVSNPDFYRTDIDLDQLSYIKYKFKDLEFYAPFFEFSTLLWDYDFSSIDTYIDNYKAKYSFQNIGITQSKNHYLI